jgi:glycosyltransferase involved in cell wall biosynthesis
MRLSILIPSIPERRVKLNKLVKELSKQIAQCEADAEVVKVVTVAQKDGGQSIGQKRQMCLNKAKGEYVCFIDDDDWIAPNYVSSLMIGCDSGADVVTFNAFIKLDNYYGLVSMKLGSENEQMSSEGIVNRNAWHICPHKKELAATFNDSSYGEDWDYMSQVIPNLNTEYHIDSILTIYEHSIKLSRAKNI